MKRFIILMSALLFIMLVGALLLPSKISVAKTTEIHTSKENVIAQINDFKNWQNWFPVLKEGSGTLEIVSPEKAVITRKDGSKMNLLMMSKTPDSVNVQVTAEKGSSVTFDFVAMAQSSGLIRLDMIANTHFKWYPWDRAKGIFIDKIAGPQYEEALNNIKKAAEDDSVK